MLAESCTYIVIVMQDNYWFTTWYLVHGYPMNCQDHKLHGHAAVDAAK